MLVPYVTTIDAAVFIVLASIESAPELAECKYWAPAFIVLGNTSIIIIISCTEKFGFQRSASFLTSPSNFSELERFLVYFDEESVELSLSKYPCKCVLI